MVYIPAEVVVAASVTLVWLGVGGYAPRGADGSLLLLLLLMLLLLLLSGKVVS